MRLWQLNVVGTVVHFLLFCAVIDLYFTSPLVHVKELFTARTEPPARRVVLISADGLRADKLFGLDHRGNPMAPYIRSMVENRGAWGLSHTRIPTGSRHGHVALIAGYYESIITVTKGWGENVGEFDSTFNQSRYAWGWGSPKVLSMFPVDPSRSHVDISSPPHGLERIGRPEELDKWALDNITRLFESARSNVTLMQRLKEGKVMFFLHLMGIDTTSHSYKPHSHCEIAAEPLARFLQNRNCSLPFDSFDNRTFSEYARHVRTVDDIIHQITKLMERFYDDNKTAYIVTSDHGMTDWGAHAAGDPEETRTPLTMWGPGIRKPRATNITCGDFSDGLCQDWQLQHRARTDVSQGDVAALIAYLLNIPFPANNMGVVPLDFLSGAERDKAEGMMANAKQIVTQYEALMNEVKERTPAALFHEFQELPAVDRVRFMTRGEDLIKDERYSEAIFESKSFIKKALRGLHYYQAYNQVFMRTVLALLFLGWISHVVHALLSQGTAATQVSRPVWRNAFSLGIICYFTGMAFVLVVWLYLNGLPWTYYMYSFVAVFLWLKFLHGSHMMHSVMKQSQMLPLATSFILCVFCLEMLTMCFFYLPLISLGLVAMAAWPFTTPLWRTERGCCYQWIVSCLLVAVFPSLHVGKGISNYSLVLWSGLIAFFLGAYLLWRLLDRNGTVDIVPKTVLCVQLALVAVATLVVKVAMDRIALKVDPLPVTQWISWFILVSSPVFPMLTGASLEVRLFSVGLAFTAPYLLLSYTYDSLLYLALLFNLRCWLRLETALSGCHSDSNGHLPQNMTNGVGPKGGPSFGTTGPRNDPVFQLTPGRFPVTPGDVRRAFFCILIMMASFFGADNVANINTHDPVVAFCFFTAFKPPGIATLIFVKAAIPFLLVTCTLRAVLSKVRGSARSGQLVILLLMDFITLNFFFLVKDDGSWQEIGDCISHFAIAMLMIIITLWVPGLAHPFVPLTEQTS